MEPLVSVVVITYNHEKYIYQSLKSVLAQKAAIPIEVLVGNDASTDRTEEILDVIAQEAQLQLIHRTKNIGASANLYDLLKQAKGKYIAFLEGDDYWIDDNKLQKQFEFLKDHPNYIGCTHECMLVDVNGNMLSGQKLEWVSRKREVDIKVHRGFYLAGQIGTLMCRNIFRDSGERYDIIYKAHPLISDRTVQMVLVLQGSLYRLKECMGAYRQYGKMDGKNATTQCFVENTHSDYDNFMLTCRLEKYAQRCETENVDFSFVKKIFFTNAVCRALRKNNTELWQDVKKILHDPDVQQWRYLLFLPRGILYKLIQKVR